MPTVFYIGYNTFIALLMWQFLSMGASIFYLLIMEHSGSLNSTDNNGKIYPKNNLNEQTKENNNEEVIILHRHILDHFLLILLVVFSLAVAFKYTYLYPEYTYLVINLEDYLQREVIINIPYLFIVPLTIGVIILHSSHDQYYVIGRDYLAVVKGVWSLKMVEKRLEYEMIRGIEIDKSFLQRIFGIGDIVIASSLLTDERHINMEGVKSPERYVSIIEERIIHHLNKKL